MASDDKQLKLERVAKSILSIVARFGLENLSPSRLSRAAGVSRPWVYKYIGGSKDELTEFAVDHFGKLLARLDSGARPATVEFFRKDEILRLSNALDFSEEHPEVIQIYYRYKGTNSSLGRAIKKIENQYRKVKIAQIKETFRIAPAEAAAFTEMLLAVKMGLCHNWVMGEIKDTVARAAYLRAAELAFDRVCRLAK